MTCKEVVERLPEYWSGELDEATKNELTAHLSGCLSCQQEWALLQTAMTALRNAKTPEPPPELLVRIQAEVKARQQRKPVFVWRWQWATAAAVATFVLLCLSLPIFQRAREKARMLTSPTVAERTIPALPAPALELPPTVAPSKPQIPSIATLPTPKERLEKPRRKVLAERPRSKRISEAPEASLKAMGPSEPSSSKDLPLLSIPSGEYREEAGENIAPEISVPMEKTVPQIAQLPSEPRKVPFIAELELSERVRVQKPELKVGEVSPAPIPESPAEVPRVAGAPMARRSERIESQYPAMGQHAVPPMQMGGGQAQALITVPFSLRWKNYEPVVVGKVRLWELSLVSESPQVVTVMVQPSERVEVLNAQALLGEGKGLVLWRDKLPALREFAVPLLLRATEPGARRLKVTIETADGRTFSWWCVFAVVEREGTVRIRKPISFQVEQWTALDLLSNLAWESKSAFLVPETVANRIISIPKRTMSIYEALTLLERQLGGKWLRLGNTFSWSTPIPAFAVPVIKQ
ncbi:zf-HC2 domain-containing protein [Fervidibacter sacchari]